ncbi:MAG TPA: rhomboid family intramembrane serine protease, partial [Chroococcales cyanobacterium]
MLQNDPSQRFEFQDRPVTPIMTAMLIMLLVLVYSMGKGLAGGNGHIDEWLTTNAYSLPKANALLAKKDFSGLLSMAFITNFASFDIIQMAFNMYFFWVFGKHVEVKLGPRYLFLIMFGVLIPMAVLQFDCARTNNQTIFVGP